MEQLYNKSLKNNAQELRKNMTREEKHLWYDFLKALPITVKRQEIIGNYIVDFYLAKPKIVIEIDGIQHKTIEGINADIKRDATLRELGIKVLRYGNEDINHRFTNVCNDILKNICINASELKSIKK